jgi:hypothetical protein
MNNRAEYMLGLGMAFGLLFGVLLGHIALGLIFGTLFGLAFAEKGKGKADDNDDAKT